MQYKMGTYKIKRDSNGRFSSIWKSIKWFCKRVVIGIAIVFLLVGIYIAGGYGNPVVKAELVKEGLAPVLVRIAKCESGNTHFRNGQVILNANKDGSVDIGRFMINNKVWSKKATELGLNLMIAEDNQKFAEYLYRNYGTSPWRATESCFNK